MRLNFFPKYSESFLFGWRLIVASHEDFVHTFIEINFEMSSFTLQCFYALIYNDFVCTILKCQNKQINYVLIYQIRNR